MNEIFRAKMNPFYGYRARVASVYDGDTVRLDIDKGFSDWFHAFPIRLWGINTPELRGSAEEKVRGYAARDYLKTLLYEADGDPKDILLYTLKDGKGKYGRYLGILEVDGLIVNSHLIESGHAKPYMI